MCIIRPYEWDGCSCSIDDVVDKCEPMKQAGKGDAYHCSFSGTTWAATIKKTGHCGCLATTPESTETDSSGWGRWIDIWSEVDRKQVAIGNFGSRFQNTTKRIKNSWELPNFCDVPSLFVKYPHAPTAQSQRPSGYTGIAEMPMSIKILGSNFVY